MQVVKIHYCSSELSCHQDSLEKYIAVYKVKVNDKFALSKSQLRNVYSHVLGLQVASSFSKIQT